MPSITGSTHDMRVRYARLDLDEFIDQTRAVYKALRDEMFFVMGQKKKATDAAAYAHHDSQLKSLNDRLKRCRKIMTSHGIRED